MELTHDLKMVSTSTNKIVGGIFGAVLIFYLIANTFNDAGGELQGINDSITGGKFMKILLPLTLAFGIVFALYKGLVPKH